MVGAISPDRYAPPLFCKLCGLLWSSDALLCLVHDDCREALYGRLLGPFLDDPQNLFIVSSDFCHWGQRFGFTYHDIPKHVSDFQLYSSNQWQSLQRCP